MWVDLVIKTNHINSHVSRRRKIYNQRSGQYLEKRANKKHHFYSNERLSTRL